MHSGLEARGDICVPPPPSPLGDVPHAARCPFRLTRTWCETSEQHRWCSVPSILRRLCCMRTAATALAPGPGPERHEWYARHSFRSSVRSREWCGNSAGPRGEIDPLSRRGSRSRLVAADDKYRSGSEISDPKKRFDATRVPHRNGRDRDWDRRLRLLHWKRRRLPVRGWWRRRGLPAQPVGLWRDPDRWRCGNGRCWRRHREWWCRIRNGR